MASHCKCVERSETALPKTRYRPTPERRWRSCFFWFSVAEATQQSRHPRIEGSRPCNTLSALHNAPRPKPRVAVWVPSPRNSEGENRGNPELQNTCSTDGQSRLCVKRNDSRTDRRRQPERQNRRGVFRWPLTPPRQGNDIALVHVGNKHIRLRNDAMLRACAVTTTRTDSPREVSRHRHGDHRQHAHRAPYRRARHRARTQNEWTCLHRRARTCRKAIHVFRGALGYRPSVFVPQTHTRAFRNDARRGWRRSEEIRKRHA